MKTNADKLPVMAIACKPRPPMGSEWQVSHDGKPFFSFRTGGITYNIKVGDSAYGWAGDHLEPCVTCWAEKGGLQDPNRALQVFSCIGNEVRVVSGEAKGAIGMVTGKHGGAEHVMLDFADDVLEKLTYEDKLMVRAVGAGMTLPDYPGVTCLNIGPSFLDQMQITERDGKLEVPVAGIIPGGLMGSGIGNSTPFRGDYDLQTAEPALLTEHGLDALRLGDLVAIVDHHATHGWAMKKGGVIIGIVIHADSYKPGHGPGITSLLTSKDGSIVPRLGQGANIADLLGIGRSRV